MESLNSMPISGDRRVPNRVCEGYDGMWLSRLSKKVRKSTSYMNFCALIVLEISMSRINIFSLCIIFLFVTFVTKSNQKSCAVLKKLKN